MGTKEEIDTFLKDLQINPNYHVFNFNEGSQYDLEDIILKALDHFKPKPVISDSEIEERIEKTIQQTVYPIVGSIELNYFKKSLRKALYKDLKWMRSKLSTTVTEPKE